MKRILVLFLVGLFFIGCSGSTSQQIVSWEDWKENVDSIPLNEKEVIGTIKYRYIFKGEKFNGIVLQPIVYIDGSTNFRRSEYIDGLIYKESYKYNGHDFLIKWDSVKKTIQQNTYQFYDNGKVWFKKEEYLSKQFLDSISINPTFFPEDNQDLYFVKHGVNEVYYENGQLESTEEYRDGKEIGNHKYYHENGQLKSSLSYDNNGKVVDGTYRSYYVNGDLEYESNFKNGVLHGLQTWYKDGKIYQQTLVENGDAKYFIFENFRRL
jgi:antitoxin component YwqK of YwqJK toxin-antitoxin module